MNEQTDLVKHESQALQSRPPDVLSTESVLVMLKGAVDKGITTENASAVEKIVDLLERVQVMGAKKDFIAALKALQTEAKAIKAMKPVMNSKDKGGGLRYVFAPFEDIMEQLQPMLDKYNFVVTFGEAPPPTPAFLTKTCELMHISGHSKTNAYTAAVGNGPPGSSTTQASGAAHTYAKRGALCDALNIIIDKDSDGADPLDDARGVGAFIEPPVAQALRKRLLACGGDEIDFLKFATGVALSPDQSTTEDILFTYLKIPKSKLPEIEASLERKEGKAKKK